MDNKIEHFLGQLKAYQESGATAIEFVFKGSVPDAVREALENAGAIVKVVD